MDTITVQAKIGGVWQRVPLDHYGPDVPSVLGAMNGDDVVVRWEQQGEETWYYCGTEALAKAQRVKTKYVSTIAELIEIYYRKRRSQ